MAQKLGLLKETPSQTAGPYVHIGCMPNLCEIGGVYPADLGASMAGAEAKGERITIRGRIYDGTGTPLKDAMVEIWQADAGGCHASPADMRAGADPRFTGWGRSATDAATGEFAFETVKPGRVPYPDGRMMAPHVSFWIVARGINLGLNTRMYFSDEAAANAEDPVLGRLEHQNRVSTLIGRRNGAEVTFDIHLQGENETVFFDI